MKTETDLKLRRVFTNMKVRCYNVDSKDYINYGGRGIKICKDWLDNPKSFYQWAVDNGYQIGLQIDRENNDIDYTPDNCRWVEKTINNRNKRDVKLDADLVREIRYGKYKDLTRREVSVILNCSKSTIEKVVSRKIWVEI